MSENYDFDLLCIGSGPAGQRAAVQAAKLGKRVGIVDRLRVVGGACVKTGTIPSKTFREAIRSLLRGAERARSGSGFRFKRRPAMEQLLEKVTEVIEIETETIEDQLERNDVTILRGTAKFVEPHTVAIESPEGSRLVRSDKILVACGTRPASPPGVSADGELILTSDDVIRLKHLPRQLVVVGGGVIGIEYASMFASLGVEVTLIDRRERPLEFLDREIVDELIHQMRNSNVTFRLEEAVERLDITEGPNPKAVVFLESGKRLVSDAVLFSVGRVGATDSLDIEAAGLKADERGRLKVDECFRTEVPHIFAAGDVIGYPSLASTSFAQGRLVACHAFGVEANSMPENLPIGIYAIPEMSMVGSTEHELTEKKIPYETGVARFREIARGQILGDNSGFFKMLFHRDDRRLLGVHIIGTDATELLHIGQAVLNLGGGLDYFLETIFNYPTLAECYKVAAFDASNKLRQVDKVEALTT